jgi:Lon protease-like protein
MTAVSIPLFPLNTVLFPGGPLKLRIFEARYVDMIGRCLREDSGFGVALIIEGMEAGGPARTANVGTLARIVDFEQLQDGLLGITARGRERFRIDLVREQRDGLKLADVEWLPEEPEQAVSEEYSMLAELARQAFPQLAAIYGDDQPSYENATWVGMRLAEMLPLPAEDRQRCLEILDGTERLQYLSERIRIERT